MYRTEGNPPLYKWKLFEDYSHIVNAGITCREGGISNNQFNSFNQALHCGDHSASVIKNRTILCSSQNISFKRYTSSEQTHSANIHLVDEETCGSGREQFSDAIKNTDALIVCNKNIMINIHIADCVPIVIFDIEKRVGALIHAGWRGTAKLITLKTVEYMTKELNCNPEHMIAGVGPSIGSCCFDIGIDTASALRNSFPYSDKVISEDSKSYHADLKKANREQLLQCGLSIKNIEASDICTSCHNDEFYSYRATAGRTGRFSAFMILI